jgi:hypothetical protein
MGAPFDERKKSYGRKPKQLSQSRGWMPLWCGGHLWMSQAGDYYELYEDLGKYESDSSGTFVGNED